MDWTSPRNDPKLFLGIENFPDPIKAHIRRSSRGRPSIKKVYHVTDLLYCLRKQYYRRTHESPPMDMESSWNIYRGNLFDGIWSPLFPINQRTYHIKVDDITITGTCDFVWFHPQNLGEKVIYDLKVPRSIYYKEQTGAGKIYIEQVQSYLAMAHHNGDLLDVHKCGIAMVGGQTVIEIVDEKDSMLDYIIERAKLLDRALEESNPNLLTGPEMKWECNEAYCPINKEFRKGCPQKS